MPVGPAGANLEPSNPDNRQHVYVCMYIHTYIHTYIALECIHLLKVFHSRAACSLALTDVTSRELSATFCVCTYVLTYMIHKTPLVTDSLAYSSQVLPWGATVHVGDHPYQNAGSDSEGILRMLASMFPTAISCLL